MFVVAVAPIAFGAIAGLALSWSAPAWWALQCLGALGAVSAGREHVRRREAAVRGLVVGLFFAASVLCVRALPAGDDVADLGDPLFFPVVAALAAGALQAVGVARRPHAPVTGTTTARDV
ncbi:hypothetical protein [Streptomyces sp. NPDC056296]|uniref:hypothetical protein n=1 Tax=Streptomyces sp. NPDC056296 TaxID=3345775 RepID=UPI0035DD577F